MTGLAYRSMWIFALFDLPVKAKRDRKEYARFRKLLLGEGFTMLQFSVYARHCASEETATSFAGRLSNQLPPHGQVRLLTVTDRQFAKMEVYAGGKRGETEEPPAQLLLF